MMSVVGDKKHNNREADEALTQALQEKADRERDKLRSRQAMAQKDARIASEGRQQTLGSAPDRAQRSRFVLEEEDEEFEDRMDDVQKRLLVGAQALRQGAKEIGHELDYHNDLVKSLDERVRGSETSMTVYEYLLTNFIDQPSP
jgi:hypothetical protein